ncbi:MAG: hypothetical protein JWP81_3998 [Ferruginibacter sp.]|nr:hypothetical protein [Ferruginibacter sp.]
MNFTLSNIPLRTTQPRADGITIISDRGLSIAEAENLLSVASPYIDIIKLAFGTAMVTPSLIEKIKLFRSHNIPVCFGGLLLEAFIARNQLNDYIRMLDMYEISVIEVSDGSFNISHKQKCDLIRSFSKIGTVISEVGSKDKDKVLVTPPYRWIELMKAEFDAGSQYIIAEAKELGNEGLYRHSGEVREGLVQEILTQIAADKIIWEAPRKEQQLFFIKLLGCNANLGNIMPQELIALEAMRIGLRADSFDFFMNQP